ncbi:hypothetical protein D9Q98_007124 [Chlorella vulgaris]|uniref:Uncharacterized protein n=1 Tax=Chlorella vulgaris TaxID=3077 RepID=A0A9D4YUI0_CHLVU|nr:hypothetical protein D9Q98_007124 [Chlorella vulgaris]
MSALRLAAPAAARGLDSLAASRHQACASLRGFGQPPPHFPACRARRDGPDAAGMQDGGRCWDETFSPPPAPSSGASSTSSQDAEGEMLRQILQISLDNTARIKNLGAKFEALQDRLEATNATAAATNATDAATNTTAAATNATAQAIKAEVVDMKARIDAAEANFAAFQVELQAANEEAACLDRKMGELEAAVANAAARFPQRRRAGRAEFFKNGRVARR